MWNTTETAGVMSVADFYPSQPLPELSRPPENLKEQHIQKVIGEGEQKDLFQRNAKRKQRVQKPQGNK